MKNTHYCFPVTNAGATFSQGQKMMGGLHWALHWGGGNVYQGAATLEAALSLYICSKQRGIHFKWNIPV